MKYQELNTKAKINCINQYIDKWLTCTPTEDCIDYFDGSMQESIQDIEYSIEQLIDEQSIEIDEHGNIIFD